MRKTLLGTTALIAASVLGGEEAQAKFDVTINGVYMAIYGFIDEDDNVGEQGFRRQNQALNQDSEIHFRFKQTFDNGITAGGRVGMKGATNNGGPLVNSGSAGMDQIDEKWGYIRGGFGELRFGDDDDARRQFALRAPFATVMFMVSSVPFSLNNYQFPPGHAVFTNSTQPWLELESAKLLYFTPEFNGFQLAASYAPDGTQDRSQAGTGGTDELQFSNAMSLAGAYKGEVGGLKVNATVGVSKAYSEMSAYEDPLAIHAGLNVGIGAFTVGGSIGAGRDLTQAPGSSTWNFAAATEADTFDIGASYAMGPMTFSLGWSHGAYKQLDNNTDTLDHVQLSAASFLGEGLQVGAMVGLFDYDDKGPADSDNSGWQTAVGIIMFL
jgi:hypothetical protein